MRSWLTLSGDIRQKLAYKEKKSCFFLLVFSINRGQNIFFSQHEADHVAGDRARTFMSRMETRASSLIIFLYL